MNSKQAYEILKKYMTKPNLLKHSIAVSACMEHFAKLEKENADYWGAVGMLHDVDYEINPKQDHSQSPDILKKEGFDDEFIYSVQSHAYGICSDVEPKLYMEKVLLTVDQLSGFIIACALIRPEKKLEFVTMESIKKRWKVPTFAGGTNRERIMQFCEKMGKSFDYIAKQTLIALQGIAGKLGL